MSFNKKYCEILDIIKDEIQEVTQGLTREIDIKEPLMSKLSNILNAPSKHIRAAAAFLYIKAIGKDIDEKQIMLQTAVELVHNASLIHDDVIDECSLRRNQQTINKALGNKLAVITGDYLLSIALKKICLFKLAVITGDYLLSIALKKICLLNSVQLTEMFAQTLDKMCQGEINQHFTRFEIPTLDEYLKKSRQKTASLFETAICGAVLISGEKEEACEFAKNFGTAFQIRDDLINIKTSKSDIKDGIYTAPVIFSGDLNTPEKGIEKTELLLNNYVNKALISLKNINDNIYKQKLRELTELLANGQN